MEIGYPTEGTYVIGATGSGKSSFLAHRMLEDAKQNIPFTLIDPKIDLADLICGHVRSVTVLDVNSANFGINLFECPDPRQLDLITDRVMQVFHKVFGMNRETNARLRQYLRNTAKLLILTNGTMKDVPRVLINRTYRETLLTQVREPTVREFWAYHASLTNREQQDRIESTYDRVDEFLGSRTASRIFSSHSSTIDWTRAFDTGQTIIVRLSPQLEQLSSLVGAVVMAQIAAGAFSRKERFQYSLYCDEYHRFATPATDDLLTQGRSFGMATTVAHQYRSQLDYHSKGATIQCGNTIVFRVSPPDNDELAGIFEVPAEEGRVIGRIAVQAVDPSPIGALMSKGHANPEVRRLIQHFLIPLVDYYRTNPNSEQVASAVIRQMNRYFNGLMEKRFESSSSEAFQLIYNSIINLKPVFLGCDYIEKDLEQAIFLSLRDTMKSGVHNWDIFEKVWLQIESENRDKWFEGEKSKHLKNTPLKQPWKSHHQAFVQANPYQWESHRQNQRQLMLQQEAEAIAQIEARKQEVLSGLLEWIRSERMYVILKDRVHQIIRLGKLLQQDPVMTETDQFEEIRERPRSVADRQGEIANKLASLPLGTAWVKARTKNGYYQGVESFPPPPAPTGFQFIFTPFVEDEEPELVVINQEEDEILPPLSS